MDDTGMGEGSNDPQEPEIEIEQKGSITVMYGNGMQIVFNTTLDKKEFEDVCMYVTENYLKIPIDETNIRIINLRHIFFMDYGPIQDMEKLREELAKKQAEQKAAQQSSIIRPGGSIPGVRKRLQ